MRDEQMHGVCSMFEIEQVSSDFRAILRDLFLDVDLRESVGISDVKNNLFIGCYRTRIFTIYQIVILKSLSH